MQTFRWMRVLGDTVFAAGIAALLLCVVGLSTGWSIRRGAGWWAVANSRAPEPANLPL